MPGGSPSAMKHLEHDQYILCGVQYIILGDKYSSCKVQARLDQVEPSMSSLKDELRGDILCVASSQGSILYFHACRVWNRPAEALSTEAAQMVKYAFAYTSCMRFASVNQSSTFSWMIQTESTQMYSRPQPRVMVIASLIVAGSSVVGKGRLFREAKLSSVVLPSWISSWSGLHQQ